MNERLLVYSQDCAGLMEKLSGTAKRDYETVALPAELSRPEAWPIDFI